MKLALIYDPKCPKLTSEAYSQTYRDMFLALADRFDETTHITQPFDADYIDADCIIFFDIHSSHHIEIKNIKKHKAVKYEYFNDPWQDSFKGKYSSGDMVIKLGPKDRTQRAVERGVDYIICPYEPVYYRFIAPHLPDAEKKLVWFPVAPDINRFRVGEVPLTERKPSVLLNGHLWIGREGFRPYEFRRWAYKQNICENVEHGSTAVGLAYPLFLALFAGSAALCDEHICPKYSEIPLAGCVCFAQYHHDYEKMGFKDGESCICVTKANFKKAIKDFVNHVADYQPVADAGRKLIKDNWTAEHFAEHIYQHARGSK